VPRGKVNVSFHIEQAVRLPMNAHRVIHTNLMRLSRSILCILFALLWWPATNSCLIASVLTELMEPVCECSSEHEEKRTPPCGSKDCSPCVTLENGANLAALQQPVVPPPVMTVTDSFAALLEKFARLEAVALVEPPPVPPPIPPPVWRHDVTTAQPVRGPSSAV
jgi:hypothetical protein